ncbi:MAG: hypothetical protein ACREIT_01685 [Tepidisphaeraceae bacterium]
MHGVTTAIVGFLFVCIVLPQIVKNRSQYYAALVAILLVILLDAIAAMVRGSPGPNDEPGGGGGFAVVAYVFCAILQIFAILLLVMSAGGISARELAGDMKRAYEVIRRGEEEKEIIIPLSNQPPRAAAQAGGGGAKVSDQAPHVVYKIDEHGNDVPAKPAAPPDHGSVPMAGAKEEEEEFDSEAHTPNTDKPAT